MERFLDTAPLMIGTGAVESAGGKANRPGLFMEVLRDRLRLTELK